MNLRILLSAAFITAASCLAGCAGETGEYVMGEIIELPRPRVRGRVSVEEAINRRYSVRNFSSASLSLSEVSQILWSAGGLRVDAVSSASRTYPSAGGAHPLEFYLAAGAVEGLEAGLYYYDPSGHLLRRMRTGDIRSELASSALGQGFVRSAPATVVIAADYGRSTGRYGERGVRYVYMDAGHSGENIYLACAASGLGTVAVGAFNDRQVNELISPPGGQEVIYLFPIGRPE